MDEMLQVLDKKGPYYFHKHIKFLELIEGDTEEGDYTWSFSMEDGLLKIETGSGRHLEFEVEVLGTIDDATNTFLWAWANVGSDIPNDLLNYSRAMRTYGQQHDIGAFTDEIFELSELVNPNFIGLISTVLCESHTYFIGGHEKGAIVLLIKDERFPEIDKSRLARDIFFCFTNYISNFFVENHLEAFIHYIEIFGLKYDSEKGKFFNKSKMTVRVFFEEEDTVEVKFDKQNRMLEFQIKAGHFQ